MRTVALEETFYFAYPSRAFADGIPEALGGTPDLAAIELDGTNAVIDAGITTAAHGSLTAVNIGTVAAAAANGYEAGKVYGAAVDAGTVDGVSAVGEVVYEFRVEPASELAARKFREAILPVLSPTSFTGNTTSALNLTGIVASTAEANDVIGEVFGVQYQGGTFDQLLIAVRVTAYAVTNQLATVEQLDGSAMPEAVASGDYVFRVFGADPKWAAEQALTDIKLDHLVAVADADDPADDSIIAKLAAASGDWSDFVATTDALQAIIDNLSARTPVALVNGKMDATVDGAGMEAGAVAVIADGVLDELMVGHQTTGTLGAAIGDGDAGAGLTEAGGTGDQLTALATQASVNTIDGIVDDILLDTAEIGAAGAGLTEAGGTGDQLTALATAANLATVAGYLDTEIAAILEDTGTSLPALIAALNDLSAAAVNAEADTAIADAFGIVTGSVNDASAAVTGFTVTDDAGSDIRLGTLRLTSGALAGESRLVTWTGTTVAVVQPTSVPAGLTTVGPFSAAPANGVTYTFRPL
jgi:hypothetical protein